MHKIYCDYKVSRGGGRFLPFTCFSLLLIPMHCLCPLSAFFSPFTCLASWYFLSCIRQSCLSSSDSLIKICLHCYRLWLPFEFPPSTPLDVSSSRDWKSWTLRVRFCWVTCSSVYTVLLFFRLSCFKMREIVKRICCLSSKSVSITFLVIFEQEEVCEWKREREKISHEILWSKPRGEDEGKDESDWKIRREREREKHLWMMTKRLEYQWNPCLSCSLLTFFLLSLLLPLISSPCETKFKWC